MLEDYNDIKKRIKEKPKWYDGNGVPRYDKFHPNMCPDIYADEVVLLKIACQYCGREFSVEMHHNKLWSYVQRGAKIPSFSESILDWLKPSKWGKNKWPPIHYGDPPRHDCTGDTMNVFDLRIIEFWEKPRIGKGKGYERWCRRRELEIELEKFEEMDAT